MGGSHSTRFFFPCCTIPMSSVGLGGALYVEKENELDVTVFCAHFVLLGAYLPKRILSSKSLVFEDRCQ